MDEPRNPYAHAIRVSLVASGACLVLAIGGLAGLAARWKPAAWLLFALPLLLCSLIMLAIFWWVGRAEMKAVRALFAGDILARWTYGGDEWSRFTEAQWAIDRRRAKMLPFAAGAGFLLVGLAVGWMSGNIALGLMIGVGMAVPLGLIIGGLSYWFARAAYRQRLTGPGEIVIGPGGMYQFGRYTSWSGLGASLAGVKILPGPPPVLVFMVRGHRGAEFPVRVLIPAGREAEAGALASALDLARRS